MIPTQVQLLLTYLGYYSGEIDGKWGPASQAGTREFQRDFGGLDPDGKAGPLTQAALRRAVGENWKRPENPAKEPAEGFWAGIRYFDREEFRCHCGGKYCGGFPEEPEERLLRAADQVREHFSVPVTVSSGVRCPKHNRNVGGVYNSRHLTGKAMDFAVSGIPAQTVLGYVQSLPEIRYAYAINESYVHMDVT